MQVERSDPGTEGGLVDGPVFRDHSVFHGEKGDAPVHGPGVEVEEGEFCGDHLGEGALSGGGIAVDGYDDIWYGHNNMVRRKQKYENFVEIDEKNVRYL